MKKKIAFVCVHNSCRSQIAEALGKKFLSQYFDFYSCGTQLKPQINQDAVCLIKKMYDIDMEKTQYSKLMTDIPTPDIIISMGCQVTCPYMGKDFDENWGLEDPTGKDDKAFQSVILQIEKKVKELEKYI
ncbi:MAG: arsenate reductase ArsC [Longibaculum sp.]